ncbi:hypothetical protein D0Y65_047259 [Glycine soja]|uniref:Uncharacterized protein n=1 Tax=Glycine soja TaxID=3848 RepID=A0A445FMZ0_GLYSO|nr:hypothetical protein D0Y65_047259 [Glycine soja]
MGFGHFGRQASPSSNKQIVSPTAALGTKQRRSEAPYKGVQATEEADGNLGIVLLHPYSILGGCQALLNGYTAFTFDMRGVAKSTGSSQVKDVVAVCNCLSNTFSLPRILLLGSSAGAPIAGSAVDQIEQVIGYPSYSHQNHFIMGTQDGFTSVKQLRNKLNSAAGRVETHLIDGVGHFQMEGPGYDAEMVDLIIKFIASL